MKSNQIIISIFMLTLLVACSKQVTEQDVTPKICTADWAPVCGVDGITYSNECSAGDTRIAYEGECISDHQITCEENNGTWIKSAQECEGVSKDTCDQIGGTLNECASACRNDPDAEICTLQCVLVCEIKEAHMCTEEEKENQICTREYNPVCGSDGQTHSTGCTACATGIESWTEGECPN